MNNNKSLSNESLDPKLVKDEAQKLANGPEENLQTFLYNNENNLSYCLAVLHACYQILSNRIKEAENKIGNAKAILRNGNTRLGNKIIDNNKKELSRLKNFRDRVYRRYREIEKRHINK